MPNVVIYGWEEGFKTISFIKLLKQSANIGLKEVADIRDCVVAHQEVSFSFETEEAAQTFVRDVVALGLLARVDDSMSE